MLRRITQAAGRFQSGNLHDYPQGVWNKIAADLMASNPEMFKGAKDVPAALDVFSEAQEFNAALQSVTRGPVKVRQRLGSAAREPLR